MTCREKLKIEHPDHINMGCLGGCAGCPSSYKYLDTPDYCGDVNIPANERCTMCWDREIPETETSFEHGATDSTPEGNEKELTIEIVYTDGTHDLLYGVKYFELVNVARVFKIQHVDSDIYTFIPAEHVIRIGKVWEDVD